jgi:D-glycero-D-manno-heptose 1,7-bisphosphate phosphatase
MTRRAVFLDRDGVLNANVIRDGKPFAPRKLADFRLLDGVEDAVRRLRAAGFLAIIVTNQPDIPAGFTTRAEFDAMQAELLHRIIVDDVKVCFHREGDGCACRKPAPGMLLEAAAEHDIDLKASFIVGDRWRDIGAGHAAGCFAFLVDHGVIQERPTHPDRIVTSLAEAADVILREWPW